VSDTRSIAAVTVTLRHMLQEALVGTGASVTVDRPGAAANGTPPPSANLFLYQVTPNGAWRDDDLPTRRADGRLLRKPQAALDLHYLLSFYGDDKVFLPQRLLGRTTRALHAMPVLSREMIAQALAEAALDPELGNTDVPGSDLAAAVELVRVTPSVLSLEDLSKLWAVFFQTPYALSVAYQASVVLIEDDREEPIPGLPVSRRNVYVVPFHQPVVGRAEPTAGPQAPIVWNSSLSVLGRNLVGQVTRVRVGTELLDPTSVEDTRIEIDLASIPAPARRAGATGLQVVHDVLMGTPETPHRGSESNLIAFVLRPLLSGIAASTPQATVGFQVEPPVRAHQRTTLLLDERPGGGGHSYAFAAGPADSDLSTLEFQIANVEPGDYFVRLRVDGAESPLEVVEDEKDPAFQTLTGPEVHIP
jgi:Pvc16 N-terminal domain